MKDKKNILGIAIIIFLITCLGITYAWFNAKIESMNSKVSTVTTGSLKIKYVDGDEISLTNMVPGDYIVKEFSVTNAGTETVTFNLENEIIENTVIGNELVIDAACTRLNGVNVEGTCDDIKNKSVTSSYLVKKISIDPGITYKYNIKLLFKETYTNQNHNMGAKYNGKIKVSEYVPQQAIYCTFDGDLIQGAEYVNGQYTYRYMEEFVYSNSGYSWNNIDTDGWGVILTDKDSTDPVTSSLCTYINDKPVVSMSDMFAESKTESIDFSTFNTSNVINMNEMFVYSNVTDLDLNNFDTSNVINMGSMFYRTQAVTLDVSNFDTSNVTDMSYMFAYTNVNTLDLSNFDTSNVTNMYGMFGGSQAVTLDISSFDTRSVTNMGYMFVQCFNLTTIYVSDKFVTSNVNVSDAMFDGDTKLVGGAGTVYDENNIDMTYARIDGGTSNPGYFSQK